MEYILGLFVAISGASAFFALGEEQTGVAFLMGAIFTLVFELIRRRRA